MKDKITIAIDAMGGENAPDKNIQGLSMFIKEKNILKIAFLICMGMLRLFNLN